MKTIVKQMFRPTNIIVGLALAELLHIAVYHSF